MAMMNELDYGITDMAPASGFRVAIYCRLSKDDDLQGESASIANQRDMLEKYCERQGWEVVSVYQDDGYTGLNMERPDLKRMLKAVERRQVNLVITKDLRRLGRNYLQTGILIEDFFPRNGVRYIAMNDGIDTMKDNNDIAPFKNILKLLNAIDRTSVKGKRDYAAMMLGTVLGLRACDVVSLKLADIDWLRGEIHIVQSKTSNPVVLPLTQDVGEALADYILNARPEAIFLRIKAPHTGLDSAVTVGEIYRDCCIAAGLPSSTRFHNLRRALGTSMVENGVSVYDVAQVFGDRNVDSTKPYLATDMEHLKLCALSFEGIEPEGGVRQ